LQLTRPANVLIGSLSIAVGALVTGTLFPFRNVLLACISGGLITGGANGINDYYDIEIDRINKPYRPLPSKALTPSAAFFFALSLFIAGILLGALIHLFGLLIALGASILLYLYSYRLKRLPLVGNLTVSGVSALAFIYGGVAVHRFRATLIPASFAFLFHLGREIIKDVEDMIGDRIQAARTLPLVWGTKPALLLTSVIFVLLIGVTLVPYFLGVYGLWYFVTVVIGVDLFLIYAIYSMWRDPSPRNLHRLSNLLKVDMLVGLLALYFGATRP